MATPGSLTLQTHLLLQMLSSKVRGSADALCPMLILPLSVPWSNCQRLKAQAMPPTWSHAEARVYVLPELLAEGRPVG